MFLFLRGPLNGVFVGTDSRCLKNVQGWFSLALNRSRSRSRSRKSASDLVKIENRSRKRNHRLDGIGVGRIRTVSFFFSDTAYDSDAYDPVKTRLSESQVQAQLRQSSFH